MMQAGTGRIELMLLVDGELHGLDAALVGRRCRDDPMAGAAVSALEIERTLLRAAFPVEAGVEQSTLTALDTNWRSTAGVDVAPPSGGSSGRLPPRS